MSPPIRPRVLVSNDDGINAPGIRAVVAELVKANFCDVFVIAPSGERSAQSHAITLGRYMSCSPVQIDGAVEAYAVDGTPADGVMLALHGTVFQENNFDLVVSGINRGDNCGLHVIYSGTVGAAREAACKGLASLALSLDNHMARRLEDYALSAAIGVSLMKAMLGLLPGQESAPAASLKGCVINANFPIAQGQILQGLYLTHQSVACVFPAFQEVKEAPGPKLAEIEEHTPNSRVFRNYAGLVQEDDSEGGDAWALKNGWISVTPLQLCSDVRIQVDKRANDILACTSAIITHAAQDAGVNAGGMSKL